MNFSDNSRPELQRSNRGLLFKLCAVVVLMLGFGYLLVPFYKKICEVTGVNVLAKQEVQNQTIKNTQVDESRLVSVEFDANVRGPWEFKPLQRSLSVHPGQLVTVEFEVKNLQSRLLSAQAIPSYMPLLAAQYFKKVDCFCFKEQALKANEKRMMPVVFYIDPALPKEVKAITLSYTFFEIEKQLGLVGSPTYE